MIKALGPAASVSVGASGLTLRVLTASRLGLGHQASPSASRAALSRHAGHPPQASPSAGFAPRERHSMQPSLVRIK